MYPIIILSITGLITLFLGLQKNQKTLLPFTVLAIAAAICAAIYEWNSPGIWFNGMLQVSNATIGFSVVLLVSALFLVGITNSFKHFALAQPAEYYAIMQMALVGAIMMAGYQNMIMLFIGVEILSVAMYVLTGSDKQNIRGNEAAIKYFLMGAFTTGIILYGMAMIYGATGSFNLSTLGSFTAQIGEKPIHLYIGLTVLMIGLLFKVSAVPFHFWTPDVYDGAPTVFTAFMATIVKTAGFAAIYRLLFVSFNGIYGFWSYTILICTVLTLILANFAAVKQTSFKRLLAFSSISHAGFLLIAILGLSKTTDQTLIFYSLAYSLATIVAFGVLMNVSQTQLKNGRPNEDIQVLTGLIKKNKFLAVCLTIAMLSMAGIPLTGGFWAKFFVFSDLAHRSNFWVLIVAVVAAVVGIYYYFKPILATWNTEDETTDTIEIDTLTKTTLGLASLLLIILGIFPNIVKGLF